jgi:heme-degrading monooxygenase HmoA
MKVKPGREAEFESAWKEIAEQVRLTPGVIRQALARDPDDPATFMVTSDWENREAFSSFERSPEQDDLTAPLRELRESGRMVVYELMAHVE